MKGDGDGLVEDGRTGKVSGEPLGSMDSVLTNIEEMLKSKSDQVLLEATKKFRQLLSSVEREAVVEDVANRDIVNLLIQFLSRKGSSALQIEALWALTNIAGGTSEHTHLLIRYNAIPPLVAMLEEEDIQQEVLEQAVWVLGTIANDGNVARDAVLLNGALMPLLRIADNTNRTSLLRIACWTIRNLCDSGSPRPRFNVSAVLHTLQQSLKRTDDTECLSHCCWALSHLCDGPGPHIEAVVSADVCGRLVELLSHKSWRVVKPALRTIGNIVCAEDEQDYTQKVIECNAVPCLRDLISHSNREIQKEASWTLSNIAAGTVSQIQCVLDSGCIPTLVDIASRSDSDPDVRIEACWVILNACSCGSELQITHLVKAGCVPILCNLLQDSSMVIMALDGIEKVLQVGEELATQTGTNPFVPMLDIDKIQALQQHRSSAIAKRANRMWTNYFVVCAICNTSYSRHSTSTKFCNECRSYICNHCNCEVFHLSYQDALWTQLENEKGGKSKKKKKKKKTKTKSKQQPDTPPPPSVPTTTTTTTTTTNDSNETMENAKQHDGKNGNGHADKDGDVAVVANIDNDDDKKNSSHNNNKVAPPKPPTTSSSVTNPVINKQQQKNKQQPLSSTQEPLQPHQRRNRRGKTPSKEELRQVSHESMPAPLAFDDNGNNPNEEYVDFVSNGGSLLDLWKMINENEGDTIK